MADLPTLKVKIQIRCGGEIALGPGKADLLDGILREGSISAAGRLLGMSYRRTWMLVDTMNRCWDRPLVETVAGGSKGGGARLTDFGIAMLGHYRALQRMAASLAASEEWEAMRTGLREQPRTTQKDDAAG